MIATNGSTLNNYTTTAAADGSVTVPVQGNAGDAISVKARDANQYPLESRPLPLGTLQSSTPIPSQINKPDWTPDTNYFPRTLSRDGQYLAVASYPLNNGL